MLIICEHFSKKTFDEFNIMVTSSAHVKQCSVLENKYLKEQEHLCPIRISKQTSA